MARASAGVMSAARTVVSASTVVSAATRRCSLYVVFNVVVFRALTNVLLVVLIVPSCRPNGTVSVSCVILHYAALGISSSIGLWGNILLELRFNNDALVTATKGSARDTGVGHGSSWHPDDIDKQRASSPTRWRSAFENARVVGEIVTRELWVAKLHHQVRYVVATKNREGGIRIVLEEAVLSLAPQRNELAGLHMPGHARRTISETHRHRVYSLQDELSILERYALRVLHEKDIHVARLLSAGSPGYQRIFIGRFGWRLRMGRR